MGVSYYCCIVDQRGRFGYKKCPKWDFLEFWKGGVIIARPSKSANTIVGKHGKENLERRIVEEKRLKGCQNNLKPSNKLNNNQKKIFRFIVKTLENTNILGSLDSYILERAAVCIDTIQQCEEILNTQGLFDENGDPHPAYKIKKDEMVHFFRIANELSLSPQSRAKLANLNLQVQKDEKDQLLEVLKDDE